MSWKNQTSSSPHTTAPKIQQQSWDECNSPTINLYDPRNDYYQANTSTAINKNSPNHQRKVNYNQYCLPNPTHQISDPGTYYMTNQSPQSPIIGPPIKSPKSSAQNFVFESSTVTQLPRTPLKIPTANCKLRHNYVSSDSAPAVLSSPRKYEYGAISPNIDSLSSSKKFDYCSPLQTLELEGQDIFGSTTKINNLSVSHNEDKFSDSYGANTKEEHNTNSSLLDNQIFFATCSPKNINKNIKKRAYNKSPDGVFSLDEYTTTITYETNTPSRRMSITISDGHSSSLCNEPLIQSDKMESTSLITPATNCSHTTGSPLPSPSTSSGLSMATTASCNTMESKQSKMLSRSKNMCNKVIEELETQITNSQENLNIGLQKRRHAINITSNPGYNTLHNSHSTLDRTCSDSVVSLMHRKSTSDLTQDDPYRSENDNGPALQAPQKYRRRGSSKGGLAYLVEKSASRRGSRESVRSQHSQHSNFSNEDIGPLTTFQATQRGRQRRTSNFLELPTPDHVRPRVCSLPADTSQYNPRVSEDLYRLRTFSISRGTVVNCGDSIISRRSRSNTSVNSTTSRLSERSPFDGSCCGGYAGGGDDSKSLSSDSDPSPPPRYRVVMMGDSGTGKTALVSQFMTSEYMHTYDASLDDEFGEKTVSVLLDGEESEMIFIDHPAVEMSVENSLSTYEPHACIIVYSIVQRSSFRVAEEILNYLWRENVTKDKAVIVVGNKADLARSRCITTQDGKQLAASRDVKFIETSSGIQHNVDELLVGILKQIRLKETREKKQSSSKMRNSKTHISLHVAKEILQKICFSDISKSKSCENLHVLRGIFGRKKLNMEQVVFLHMYLYYQIRLKETREKKQSSSKMRNSKTHISLHVAKEILQKICFSDISKSKSCENLHVLNQPLSSN